MRPNFYKLKHLYVFCIFFIVLSSISYSFAQSVANYTVNRATSISYNSIISAGTGTSISSWRNTGAFLTDDNRSYPINIGFDFWYYGTRYTQISVSTNGFCDFSSSTANGTAQPYTFLNGDFSNVYNNGGATLTLAPFFDDLTTYLGTDPLGSSIQYASTGSAPNRIFTVEWANMAVYGNTAPNLNFQLKIYETTGVIEYVYGTMNNGGFTFSYSCGITGSTLSVTPTATELLTQQTANTTTFSNTRQDALATMPTTNSKLTFTPPLPSPAASGSLSFSGTTKVQTTLNWTTDWATNERGYVVFMSTDNVTFSFSQQVASGILTATVTGLSSGTTYYFRIYAVTEGALSTTYVSNSVTTSAPAVFVSRASGNWNTSTTWSLVSPATPTAGDIVTVSATHTVTVNINNPACKDLTINGILRLNAGGATAITFPITGTVSIASTGTFDIATTSNTTHTINYSGTSITNNGALNFSVDANSLANLNVTGTASATITGTGATTRFNRITENLTSISNSLTVSTATFVVPANFLTLTAGTFNYAVTGTTNVTAFAAANVSLANTCGITLNSASATFNIFTTNTNSLTLTMLGALNVQNGILNIGSGTANSCVLQPSNLTISGGTVNVCGRLERRDVASTINFTMSNGTLTINPTSSSSTTNALFLMDVVGSSFTMSNGTIVFVNEGGTGAQNLGMVITGAGISGTSVTGGTIQFGNGSTSAGQTFSINSTKPIFNLSIASANATVALLTNALIVQGNYTNTGGVFQSTNLNITIAGNWTASSTSTFTPGAGTVTFNGSSAQAITKTSGTETFNSLALSGSNTVTLGSAISCAANITIGLGATFDVSATNYAVSLMGNWTNNGTYTYRAGTVTFNGGTLAQTITGATNWYNITQANTAGVSISSGAQNLYNTLTVSNGTFTTGSLLTLKSLSTNTARIASLIGGTAVSGAITMERYMPGGLTGWAMLGVPVTGTTLAQYTDDIYTSGFTGSTGNAAGFVSIYSYDETNTLTMEDGYVAATNVTNSITAGKGLFVYVGDAQTTTNNITTDVTGPAVQGNFNFNPTYTTGTVSATDDGWNLVSNPYPCEIDWEAATGWTKTNISTTFTVYNADIGNYATYTTGGISTNSGSRYIASSQGFWVKATAASPTLTCTEQVKVTNQNPTFFRMGNTISNAPKALYLRMQGVGTYSDETAIIIGDNYNSAIDENEDAYKRFGTDPASVNISSVVNAKDLTLNFTSLNNGYLSLPIRVLCDSSATYSLSWRGLGNFPNSACVNLYDSYTNQTISLNTAANYSFNHVDTTKAPRFYLQINMPINIEVIPPSCSNNNIASVAINNYSNNSINYNIATLQNTTLLNGTLQSGINTINTLNSGTYLLSINLLGACGNLTDTLVIPESLNNVTASFTCLDTVYLADGGIVDLQNTSQNSTDYKWIISNGDVFTIDISQYAFVNAGSYDITLIAQNNSCSDTVSKNIVVLNGSAVTSLKKLAENKTHAYINNDDLFVINGLPNMQWVLIDNLGRKVEQGILQNQGTNKLCNMSQLVSGVYYLRTCHEGNIKMYKLLKQ